jgi:hypothetical protein
MGHTRGVSSPPPTYANHPSAGPRPPHSGTSAGQVLGVIAAFLVLAAVGATLGWRLTDVTPAAAARGSAPPASASTVPSASPSPQSTPSETSTPTATPGQDGFVIPDYAAKGTLFKAARDELRGNGLAVDLIFANSGSAQTVNRTDPAAGSPAARGITVKVYVNGVAPPLGVPPIPNNTRCSDWGRQLASIGFVVAGYQGSRSKPVMAESADQNDPNTVWNQQITLTCGDDNPQPSSSPSTADTNPPGGSPSPSAGP